MFIEQQPVVKRFLSESDQDLVSSLEDLLLRMHNGGQLKVLREVYVRLLEVLPPEGEAFSQQVVREQLLSSSRSKLALAKGLPESSNDRQRLEDQSAFERVTAAHLLHMHRMLAKSYQYMLEHEEIINKFDKDIEQISIDLDTKYRYVYTITDPKLLPIKRVLKKHLDYARDLMKATKQYSLDKMATKSLIESVIYQEVEPTPEQVEELLTELS